MAISAEVMVASFHRAGGEGRKTRRQDADQAVEPVSVRVVSVDLLDVPAGGPKTLDLDVRRSPPISAHRRR
jgi:hypothetical protein